MKLELNVEKDAHGLFSATVTVKSSTGATRHSLSMRDGNVMQAISQAMEPLVRITPNLTQEEVDAHFLAFP